MANERGVVFERMADDATPIRPTDYGLVFGGSKTMLQLVGWVERSETHRDNFDTRWVSQELNPSYELWSADCRACSRCFA